MFELHKKTEIFSNSQQPAVKKLITTQVYSKYTTDEQLVLAFFLVY